MTAIAGVDVGNATTEVVIVADGAILGAGRAPTRGRKGSPDSLRGAAALVRRVARQAGRDRRRGADRAAAPGRHVRAHRPRRAAADGPPARPRGGRRHARRRRRLRRRAALARESSRGAAGRGAARSSWWCRRRRVTTRPRPPFASCWRRGRGSAPCSSPATRLFSSPTGCPPRSAASRHRPGGPGRRGGVHAARGRGAAAWPSADDAGRPGGAGRAVRPGRARRR